MRSTTFSATAATLLVGIVSGQTFTDCNPTTNSSCPSDAAIGGTQFTDFTKGESDNWSLADGTTMSYDGTLGAEFVINKATNAPTISNTKYMFFGSVSVFARAAAGQGIVSSFILESDDLDEIDWEWLGSNDTVVENNFFGKGNTTTYNRAQYPAVASPIENFHNYTIDWTSSAINWLIDGVSVRTLSYGDALALGGQNYPQTPMKVKMGNWVGCADAAAETDPKTSGTCSWAGGAADFTKAPFTMYVANVTIIDAGCATEYTYGDMTGSYQSIKSSGGCSGNSTDSSSSSSSSSSSGSSTATSSGSSTKATDSSSGSSASGKSTATGSSSGASSTGSSSGFTTGSSTSSSGAAQSTSSGADTIKPKHSYGTIDVVVMVLGLGLGYLVM